MTNPQPNLFSRAPREKEKELIASASKKTEQPDLILNNTTLASFKDFPLLSHIKSFSFVNTPISKYDYHRIMAAIVIGEHLDHVNFSPLSPLEKLIANYTRQQCSPFLLKGWVLTSVDPIVLFNPETRQRKKIFNSRDGINFGSFAFSLESPMKKKSKMKKVTGSNTGEVKWKNLKMKTPSSQIKPITSLEKSDSTNPKAKKTSPPKTPPHSTSHKGKEVLILPNRLSCRPVTSQLGKRFPPALFQSPMLKNQHSTSHATQNQNTPKRELTEIRVDKSKTEKKKVNRNKVEEKKVNRKRVEKVEVNKKTVKLSKKKDENVSVVSSVTDSLNTNDEQKQESSQVIDSSSNPEVITERTAMTEQNSSSTNEKEIEAEVKNPEEVEEKVENHQKVEENEKVENSQKVEEKVENHQKIVEKEKIEEKEKVEIIQKENEQKIELNDESDGHVILNSDFDFSDDDKENVDDDVLDILFNDEPKPGADTEKKTNQFPADDSKQKERRSVDVDDDLLNSLIDEPPPSRNQRNTSLGQIESDFDLEMYLDNDQEETSSLSENVVQKDSKSEPRQNFIEKENSTTKKSKNDTNEEEEIDYDKLVFNEEDFLNILDDGENSIEVDGSSDEEDLFSYLTE